MRIMVCQMGGCAGKEVREIKMSIMERLIQKYDVNLVARMELNFNWSKVNSSANLASWLHQEERETRSITAHNTQEQDAIFSRRQPGGTGMICRSEFIQYCWKESARPSACLPLISNLSVIPTGCPKAFWVTSKSAVQ